MKGRTKGSKICIFCGSLLLAVGLAGMLWLAVSGWQTARAAEQCTQTLRELIASGAAEDMQSVEIDGYSYIGYLSIPQIDRELPVMGDWSDQKLEVSPCRYYGSADTEDMVLMAHNYPYFFGRLKELGDGDKVCFTDLAGREWHYTVERIEILSEDQVSEMVSSGYPLTLFTCTDDNIDRLTLRCSASASVPQ